jgi:hypothetical protein
MQHLKYILRMNHATMVDQFNLTFITANALIGVITLNDFNLIIALIGAVVTLLANADKVAYSIVRVLELKRNNWRLPADTSSTDITKKKEEQ